MRRLHLYGKAINKNILTENFKRFRSNSTDEKNAAYIFKNIGIVMNDINPQIEVMVIDKATFPLTSLVA